MQNINRLERYHPMILDKDYLLQTISYNPSTGICHWNERQRTDFKYAKDHKTWNKKHAGTQIATINPSTGKIVANLYKTSHNLDQLIWSMMFNEQVKTVYHINHCAADNRFNNLTTTFTKHSTYQGGDLYISLTGYNTYAVCAGKHTFHIFEQQKDARTHMYELAEKLQIGWINE